MKLNMEQITRLVYDLSRSEHIADDKVIEKYFEFFSDEYRLDKYLKNVVISNFKNNSLAYYSPDTKTIYINFCKMIYALGLESKQCKYTDTYEDKIMMINLYIVKIIAHEIEHVLQERKINSGIYNIENDILSVANIHEKHLKANGIYKDILYYTNPIERQAELKSLKSILQVANEIDRLNIVNLITNEYLTKTISDYSIEGQQIIYPYQVFFDKKFDMEYLLNIIRKIEEMEILDCNEDLRIDMGLKLTSQEIHKIRRKLKEC